MTFTAHRHSEIQVGRLCKKLLLCSGLFLSGLSLPAAEPRATFTNPILSGMNPDPSICRAGDDFYLITSTFEYFPGLPIYQSKDLVHWKLIGHALSRPENNPLTGAADSTGGQYAATIRHHNGTFYVIGTNYGGQGTLGAFYVTANNPRGPWSDPVWLNEWYVDPSLLFADGVAYYLSPDNKGSFLLGTLDADTGLPKAPRKKIAAGLGGSSPEGPHLYKINGYYYLLSAEGGTGYEHREVVQRSQSPWGPYEPSPVNPMASHRKAPDHPFQAIGHADLIQLPDDSWWMVCLGIRPQNGTHHHLGRETFLAPVTWTDDDWPKVGTNGIVQQQYPAPGLPQHIWETPPTRDHFDAPDLRLEWNFLRNPHDADWSLTERPGFLRLHGSALNFDQKDSPAFICRRQTAFNITASAKIHFIPTAPNEEAGLIVRGNDENHYDLIITQRDNRPVVLFRTVLKNKETIENSIEISDSDIILRIRATAAEYTFWIQEEDKETLLGSAPTQNLSTETIGGFTGVFIGMVATGNGHKNTHPADFDWFDFEENRPHQ